MKRLSFCLLMILGSLALNAQGKVESQELSDWCHYLASDAMNGRRNGSPEMKAAAEWIAGQFNEAGLAHAPGMLSYVQDYSFSSRRGGDIAERNVIGFLEGKHPTLKNEVILITAHFDHVGIGRAVNGDSIYNGANDNAAGTATLIGLAHAIKRSGSRLNRSLVFAAVSGEEMGMQGSRYLAEHFPVDISTAVLNLNFEMTGHCTLLGPYRYYLTGAGFTNFDLILDEYNQTSRWQRVDTVSQADQLFFSSDNISFAVKRNDQDIALNIPAFTFCTHGGEDHIHRPHDEPQAMNYQNMASLVYYLNGLVTHLDLVDRGAIEWDKAAFNKFMERRRR